MDGLGVVKFRLVPEVDAARGNEGMGRLERLEDAVRRGTSVLHLQVKSEESGAEWRPLATVALRERLDIDQEDLRFTPFHEGAGIEPLGFFSGRAVGRVPREPAGQSAPASDRARAVSRARPDVGR